MTAKKFSAYATRVHERLERYADIIEKHRRLLEPDVRSKSERLSDLYKSADREIVRLKELGALTF